MARPQHFGLCRASLPRTCPGAAKRGPAVLIQPSVRCHADACVSPFCSPPQDTVRTLRPHAHPMSQAAGPTKHAAPTSHASSTHTRPGPLPAGSRHRHQQKKAEAAAGNGTEKWSPKRTRNRPKRWTAKKVQPQSLDPFRSPKRVPENGPQKWGHRRGRAKSQKEAMSQAAAKSQLS